MNTVGIRELKAKLSSYIDKARSGEQIVVTDHGVEVAIINPVSAERRAIMSLVQEGDAQWYGGKPKGLEGIKIRGKAISETILEERQ
ncbi:MAG: type II toxin-antitoxin system prevent-host-death family antitoxin [Nitrospiraceae bacterium]|jgi:prevent-host-death family protein|nr:MAG: type II toxin-antitoxin system prevent-host-death family antitoxin [Nitrospiraceae bacterium]